MSFIEKMVRNLLIGVGRSSKIGWRWLSENVKRIGKEQHQKRDFLQRDYKLKKIISVAFSLAKMNLLKNSLLFSSL